MRKLIGVALVSLLFIETSMASTSYMNAKVTQTLIDEQNFGLCMARLNPGPESTGLNCPAFPYITFSCSGDYSSKSIADQKFQQAQLALVTGLTVKILVDDSQKHNGYCYAKRIDVIGQ